METLLSFSEVSDNLKSYSKKELSKRLFDLKSKYPIKQNTVFWHTLLYEMLKNKITFASRIELIEEYLVSSEKEFENSNELDKKLIRSRVRAFLNVWEEAKKTSKYDYIEEAYSITPPIKEIIEKFK